MDRNRFSFADGSRAVAEPGASGNSRPPWASAVVLGCSFTVFPFVGLAQAAVPELDCWALSSGSAFWASFVHV